MSEEKKKEEITEKEEKEEVTEKEEKEEVTEEKKKENWGYKDNLFPFFVSYTPAVVYVNIY